MIFAIILGILIVAYIVYVIINPNPKSISEQFRGDDEKYE